MFNKKTDNQEDYYYEAPYADDTYSDDNLDDEYEDTDEYYDDDTYNDNEDMLYLFEERKARSSMLNFFGTIVGIIVLFALIVVIVSLINWLRSDFFHTFSYIAIIFQ